MIDVVDGGSENGRHDLQIGEHGLQETEKN